MAECVPLQGAETVWDVLLSEQLKADHCRLRLKFFGSFLVFMALIYRLHPRVRMAGQEGRPSMGIQDAGVKHSITQSCLYSCVNVVLDLSVLEVQLSP